MGRFNWLLKRIQKYNNPTNIYDSLEPLNFLTHFLGLSSYKFVSASDNSLNYVISKACSVFSVVIVLVNSVLGTYLYYFDERVQINYVAISKVTGKIDFYQIYCAPFVPIGICIINFTKQTEIANFIEEIMDIDKQMEQDSLFINHKRFKQLILLWLLIMMASLFLMEFLNCNLVLSAMKSYSLLCSFVCNINLLINGSNVINYLVFVSIIRQRFSKINETLKAITEKNVLASDANEQRMHSKVILNVIIKMKNLHLKISEVGQNINKIFSLQILLTVSLTFIDFTTHSYYSLYEIMNFLILKESNADKLHVFTTTLWALYKLNTLLLVCFICGEAQNEANATSKLIYRIKQRYDPLISPEINLFGKQLLHWNFKLSACGLFIFNMELFYNIICSATTYLTVLIQLDVATK